MDLLPAFVHESVLKTPKGYTAGFSIPGIPGIIFGRTENLAFGFTYGMLDNIDLFVEKCDNMSCLYDGKMVPFTTFTETILRKGDTPVVLTFKQTKNGVIESGEKVFPVELSGKTTLEPGNYLSFAYAYCI